MKSVRLFSDSTCDLTDEIIGKMNISIVPLYVSFDDSVYRDKIDITTDKMYEKVNELNNLPKTSAPSPSDFYQVFKPIIDAGDDVLYIGLSSKISSSIQNAVIAANELPEGRIEIIDSLNLSTGIGLLVMKAADFIESGMDLREVSERIREYVNKVRTAFIADTLEYLHKGGRCTAVQSFVGGILKIRPMINMVDGKAALKQMIRGKKVKALDALLWYVLEQKDSIEADRVTITHSAAYEDACFLKGELEKNINAKEIIITDAGCVISSHCGPGTVGILYISK